MKRRQLQIIFLLAIIALGLLLKKYNKGNTEQKVQMASANFIGCTVGNFLLDPIDSTQQVAPLLTGLGNLSYPITSKNEKAQQYFDQGLRLTFAFNHSEAHRSFLEASRLDPDAPMTYWGQAYALGPNINDPQPEMERSEKALAALAKGKKKLQKSTLKEKQLIEALFHRYSLDTTKTREELNLAYMAEMEKIAEKNSDDPHILTLYAASVMNTVPWNYWDKEGRPSPNIVKAKESLEKAIAIDPDHAGAHHYYIHMVELPQPDAAVASADKLGQLMPSAGHLVHMPSHIYIRVGRYHDAVEINKKAIAADEDYISQCYAQGLYPLTYYPHNIHFLWSSASLMGDSQLAIEAAQKTAEKVPAGEMEELHFLQNFAATPLLSYVRFGKWNDILTMPNPNENIQHLKLIWHYARGIAFIRKNNLFEAEEELRFIEELRQNKDLENNFASGFDPSSTIAALAYEIVAGELAQAQGNFDQAIAHLEKAVQIEDGLIYNEPSAWHIPPRQNLGAILFKAKRYEDALRVYLKDLEKLRQNGWSLMGLYKCQMALGKIKEAQETKKAFEEAWKHADIEIETSVF